MEVIIVDDEPVSLAVLKQLVSKLPDCQARAFTHASAALAWCEPNDPDVIIVDYMMPELDGIEFTRRLRAVAGKADTPLLMVSANSEREVRDRALQTGINDFLNKPFDSADLQARVGNMLALRSSQKRLANQASAARAFESTAAADRLQRDEPHRVLDVDTTLARLGGDARLVCEVAGIFTRTVPPLLNSLWEALDGEELGRVYTEAHSLKGAVGSVEAPEVLNSVIELETHARRDDLAGAAATFLSTQVLVARLLSELSEMACE